MDHKNPIDNWLNESFEQPLPGGDKAALWDKVNASLKADSKHPVDNWVKESFEQPLPGGDKATLWEKVNASLNGEKKKRFIFWWIIGAAAIIGAFTTYACFKSSTNAQKGLSTNKTESTANAVDSKEVLSQQKEDITATSDVSQNNTEQTNSNTQSKSLEKGEKLESANSPANNDKQTLDKQSPKAIIPKIANSEGIEDKGSQQKTDLNQNKERPTLSPLNQFAKALKPNLLKSFAFPNTQPAFAILNDTSADGWIKHTNDHPKSSTASTWTFGLGAGFSPNKEIVKIAGNGLPYVHKNYLKLRKESETALFNSQFQGYVRRHFASFYTQIGLSIVNRGYAQNYQYEINEIPITSALNGNQPDANGRYPLDDQTPYIIDPTPEKVSFTGKRNTQFMEITLNIGYTFNAGKLRLSPTIGAGINFSQQEGGTTIDYQYLKLIPYQDLFKTSNSLGYSMNAGLVLEYPLTKRLFIQAQPFYHRFITSSTQVVQQTPTAYGINFGLNLKLHRDE